jgi:hypothetical protein
MSEAIVVEVTAAGNVKIEAQGFKGRACSTETRDLELVLGGGTAKKDTKYKPEFSMPAGNRNSVKSTF